MARSWVLIAAILLLGGCFTPKPIFTRNPTTAASIVANIPLERWGDDSCGAGALSTVLRHFGENVSENDLARALPRGRHEGIVSIDLLLAARERGYAAQLVRGDRLLIDEHVRAGKPVIVMINVVDLPGEKSDRFHYVVIDGADEKKGIYRTQFGDGRARWIRLESLERPWSRAGYATLLILGKDPRLDGEKASRLRRAVALEEAGRVREAIAIYDALIADEDSALLWTNVGNANARLGNDAEAELAYRRALAIDAEYRDAMNNLAWILLQQKRSLAEAESLARRAAAMSGPDTYVYEMTFAKLLAARGKCAEAKEIGARLSTSAPPAVDTAIVCGQ